MMIVRFRSKEQHKKLLEQVKEMKESLEDIEECLEDAETETEYRRHYDEDDDRNYRGRYGYRRGGKDY